VYNLKRNEAGEVVKHKACLVTHKFVQLEGIDFEEVFAPIARMESVCILLALVAQEGWQVHLMDMKFTFLNGDLNEEVYIRQPTGFVVTGQEGRVLRLKMALYDLR
jgi:type IV secretory pathway component VirB8